MVSKAERKRPISGVYIIMNFSEKKSYVGESSDVEKRIKTHKASLKAGYHHSRKLQRDWDRIGPEGFDIIVVDQGYPWWQGPIREQFWMDFMRSLLSYNSVPACLRKNVLMRRKREGLDYTLDLPKLRNVPVFDWKTRKARPAVN